MRSTASILHLDLDAFFAAVEQRDKPSLRGKAVVVGGAGPRGVVATASYEARVFGVRSAMSGTEARRRASHAAFLGGRFNAYRQSSQIVMELLREVSPVVEPLSLDEAFVDLAASQWNLADVERHVAELRAELTFRTDGLTASVGVGSSKFIAKLASEAAKPDGARIVVPGSEQDFIKDMPIRAIPGVGPATEARLTGIGIKKVSDIRLANPAELVRELGRASGESLYALAFARDDRQVSSQREAKSISTEDTFATDLTDREQLREFLRRDARAVAARVQKAGVFARTISIKVRFADFTTITKARSLAGASDQAETLIAVGEELLADVDVREGVRLLGIGASNFTTAAQEQLFTVESADADEEIHTRLEPADDTGVVTSGIRRRHEILYPGADIEHDELGRGWVWGTGLGRVTVRFETRRTGPGPIRTFAIDDPALSVPDTLPPLPGDGSVPGDRGQPESVGEVRVPGSPDGDPGP